MDHLYPFAHSADGLPIALFFFLYYGDRRDLHSFPTRRSSDLRLAYVHMPGLGGFRRARADSVNLGWRNAGFRGYADYMETPEFAQSLEALVELAERRPTAIMCAETVPWRCHRSLIADALTARGIAVEHILTADRAEPHGLTAFAAVEGSRVTYPAHPRVLSGQR